MIGTSLAQFLVVLAAYLCFGVLLGAVPGLFVAVLLRQPPRTALWDAAIGVCGILVGLEASGHAGMHVSFLNGHGLGFRGFVAERGLVLASYLAIGVVIARHLRLRNKSISTRHADIG